MRQVPDRLSIVGSGREPSWDFDSAGECGRRGRALRRRMGVGGGEREIGHLALLSVRRGTGVRRPAAPPCAGGVLGEPVGVGLARREAVGVRSAVADAREPQHAGPESLAPVLAAAALVVGDVLGERLGPVAGLGEDLDRLE